MGTISKKLVLITVLMISAIFLSTGLYAGTKVKNVIPLNNKAYKKHKKAIVQFTHEKHTTDYKISCGECHHDNKGKALKLKKGDNVQNCIECHKNTGKLPKKIKKLKGKKKKAAKIKEMHKEALHANCIQCHKKFNKKTKSKRAPKSCKTCHKK
jgi:hypothetical protein